MHKDPSNYDTPSDVAARSFSRSFPLLRTRVVVPSAMDAEISSVPTVFPSSLKILNAKAICLLKC